MTKVHKEQFKEIVENTDYDMNFSYVFDNKMIFGDVIANIDELGLAQTIDGKLIAQPERMCDVFYQVVLGYLATIRDILGYSNDEFIKMYMARLITDAKKLSKLPARGTFKIKAVSPSSDKMQ